LPNSDGGISGAWQLLLAARVAKPDSTRTGAELSLDELLALDELITLLELDNWLLLDDIDESELLDTVALERLLTEEDDEDVTLELLFIAEDTEDITCAEEEVPEPELPPEPPQATTKNTVAMMVIIFIGDIATFLPDIELM